MYNDDLLCRGCGRTPDEIGRWAMLEEDEKSKVLERVRETNPDHPYFKDLISQAHPEKNIPLSQSSSYNMSIELIKVIQRKLAVDVNSLNPTTEQGKLAAWKVRALRTLDDLGDITNLLLKSGSELKELEKGDDPV